MWINTQISNSIIENRPSVALADYDISDRRSSAMSSLLLLFALFEGMCGFVLPICSAFRVSNISQKRYYYENFLIFQYCLSILALAYLQSLIFYYDRKENLRHKQEILFMNQMNEARRIWSDHQSTSEERQNNHINNNNNNNSNINNNDNTITTNDYSENQWNLQLQKCDDKLRLVTFISNTHELTTDGYSDSITNYMDSPNMKCLEDRTRFIDQDYGNGNISSNEDEEHSLEETSKKSNNKVKLIQSKLNVKRKRNHKTKVTNENISILNKKKITTCCSHQSNYPTKCGPFYPLAILFGDKPKVSRRECYFSRDTEGVNLYLRLGAVGFGFGVMIFDGFKIAEPWEEGASSVVSCHGHLWIPLHLLHFIYVFWQTYFLFKHHRVVFNVQKFVLRFLLCHLAVANLCQWLKTIVDEIGSEPGHDEEPTSDWAIVFPSEYLMNSNITHSNTSELKYASSANRTKHNDAAVPHHINHDNTTVNAVEQAVLGCGVTVKYLAPYLFPCAIEYSLIAGAIFYKMFEKVGHVRKESERLEKLRKANPKISQFSECHRSHKGLFVGLLLFMATLVAMSLFFIFIVKRDRRNTAITLYQGTELVLLSVSTLTCLISLFRLQALKLSDLSEEVAFDDNLLLIGLVGMLFYDLFLLVPALEAIPNGVIAAKLYAAKSIMEMIQSMLQKLLVDVLEH
ncbi:hypothetical protein MN116_008642 [Schistosoma mekongi]|uniref:Otopetrin n=1 Tax=Schistosoma mekongi TaxID=38744 RepID=A0AAE1Z6F2_SCHME|nr:hypothetical protein MN116_008642 [Schistosoma mekongi]